jgi:hypothetical protein
MSSKKLRYYADFTTFFVLKERARTKPEEAEDDQT